MDDFDTNTCHHAVTTEPRRSKHDIEVTAMLNKQAYDDTEGQDFGDCNTCVNQKDKNQEIDCKSEIYDKYSHMCHKSTLALVLIDAALLQKKTGRIEKRCTAENNPCDAKNATELPLSEQMRSVETSVPTPCTSENVEEPHPWDLEVNNIQQQTVTDIVIPKDNTTSRQNISCVDVNTHKFGALDNKLLNSESFTDDDTHRGVDITIPNESMSTQEPAELSRIYPNLADTDVTDLQTMRILNEDNIELLFPENENVCTSTDNSTCAQRYAENNTDMEAFDEAISLHWSQTVSRPTMKLTETIQKGDEIAHASQSGHFVPEESCFQYNDEMDAMEIPHKIKKQCVNKTYSDAGNVTHLDTAMDLNLDSHLSNSHVEIQQAYETSCIKQVATLSTEVTMSNIAGPDNEYIFCYTVPECHFNQTDEACYSSSHTYHTVVNRVKQSSSNTTTLTLETDNSYEINDSKADMIPSTTISKGQADEKHTICYFLLQNNNSVEIFLQAHACGLNDAVDENKCAEPEVIESEKLPDVQTDIKECFVVRKCLWVEQQRIHIEHFNDTLEGEDSVTITSHLQADASASIEDTLNMTEIPFSDLTIITETKETFSKASEPSAEVQFGNYVQPWNSYKNTNCNSPTLVLVETGVARLRRPSSPSLANKVENVFADCVIDSTLISTAGSAASNTSSMIDLESSPADLTLNGADMLGQVDQATFSSSNNRNSAILGDANVATLLRCYKSEINSVATQEYNDTPTILNNGSRTNFKYSEDVVVYNNDDAAHHEDQTMLSTINNGDKASFGDLDSRIDSIRDDITDHVNHNTFTAPNKDGMPDHEGQVTITASSNGGACISDSKNSDVVTASTNADTSTIYNHATFTMSNISAREEPDTVVAPGSEDVVDFEDSAVNNYYMAGHTNRATLFVANDCDTAKHEEHVATSNNGDGDDLGDDGNSTDLNSASMDELRDSNLMGASSSSTQG